MIPVLLAAIIANLEELASRGFNHPNSQAIVGSIRVDLEKIAAEAGQPAAPADPVQQQLERLNLAVAALAEATSPVGERQAQTLAELGILSGQVATITEALFARGVANTGGGEAPPAPPL